MVRNIEFLTTWEAFGQTFENVWIRAIHVDGEPEIVAASIRDADKIFGAKAVAEFNSFAIEQMNDDKALMAKAAEVAKQDLADHDSYHRNLQRELRREE